MQKDRLVATRRNFLLQGGALLGAAALGAPALFPGCAPIPEKPEIFVTEELMQEHGLLQRLLLVFDEIARRVKCCQEYPAPLFAETVALMRSFIQDHHEKLEEEHLFSRFEKAGRMVALVQILRRQHEAGRKLLDYLARPGAAGAGKNFIQRAQLEAHLNLLTRMYRPHAAREDSVLFPALRGLMSPEEFSALGTTFAAADKAASGREVLAQVAELEKALAIHDLEEFTPKL